MTAGINYKAIMEYFWLFNQNNWLYQPRCELDASNALVEFNQLVFRMWEGLGWTLSHPKIEITHDCNGGHCTYK